MFVHLRMSYTYAIARRKACEYVFSFVVRYSSVLLATIHFVSYGNVLHRINGHRLPFDHHRCIRLLGYGSYAPIPQRLYIEFTVNINNQFGWHGEMPLVVARNEFKCIGAFG